MHPLPSLTLIFIVTNKQICYYFVSKMQIAVKCKVAEEFEKYLLQGRTPSCFLD